MNTTSQPSEIDANLITVLPTSTFILYIDESFINNSVGISLSIASAWMALDNDGLILESSSDYPSSTYPSALHAELSALLSTIKALPPNFSISIVTNCISLITLWHRFIDNSFLPKLLKQQNHLLWLFIWDLLRFSDLSITLTKVPTYSDDPSNNRVDMLTKSAYSFLQLFTTPMTLLRASCILAFNFFLINKNICHFFRNIYNVKNLQSFSSLSHFIALEPPNLFD